MAREPIMVYLGMACLAFTVLGIVMAVLLCLAPWTIIFFGAALPFLAVSLLFMYLFVRKTEGIKTIIIGLCSGIVGNVTALLGVFEIFREWVVYRNYFSVIIPIVMIIAVVGALAFGMLLLQRFQTLVPAPKIRPE